MCLDNICSPRLLSEGEEIQGKSNPDVPAGSSKALKTMLAVLLPVKKFSESKKRLMGCLSPEERQLLARTMFDDVWRTLLQTIVPRGPIQRLLVVTGEPYVIARCRAEGVLW